MKNKNLKKKITRSTFNRRQLFLELFAFLDRERKEGRKERERGRERERYSS